ncbi:MAG: glycerate kinase [Pseudomonadota bacterium]|nr:glycerate kinase [Pseudomonadota bacterium]
MNIKEESFLRDLFKSAVGAVQPEVCLPRFLPDNNKGRIVVVGAGKAAAAMASAAEKHYSQDLKGIVVTQYGYAIKCQNIEVFEADHPIPDLQGKKAALRMLENVSNLNSDDMVLCLISGGSSALLSLPSDGISLRDKQRTSELLIRSGATIHEINTVRKHLSKIKGGRLAKACLPARVITLLISDVTDNDVSVIGSGPTVPDPSTYEEALSIVKKFDLRLPASVLRKLNEKQDESPKPGDKIFVDNKVEIIASSKNALEGAADFAENMGVKPIIISDRIEGEAIKVAKEMAEKIVSGNHPKPCVLLSGGELTVRVKGSGKGGPNTEFLLSLALELDGARGIHAIACDTDGIDGCGYNAGATISPNTLSHAKLLGLDARQSLLDNDAFNFFKAINSLVITGPTYTNVNDFRAVMISNT